MSLQNRQMRSSSITGEGLPFLIVDTKCGDVINTQQARRSEWNETRDLLDFNTELADSKKPNDVSVNLTCT